MKIEKMNDYQIRCTLTHEDLAKRHIKMSEMKYGKPKTIKLFQDIMREASLKYNFNEEGLCIMVDATPLNTGSLVLILTKVRNPEEFDARFSRFSPSIIEGDMDVDDLDDESSDSVEPVASTSSDLFDFFERLKSEAIHMLGADVSIQVSTVAAPDNKAKLSAASNRAFIFDSLHDIITPAVAIGDIFKGSNSLYKDGKNEKYILFLIADSSDINAFHKACNVLSEYGSVMNGNHINESFLEEHYELVFKQDALSRLSHVI